MEIVLLILGLISFGYNYMIIDKYEQFELEEVVFILDISQSMNAQDITDGKTKISRLELSKEIITEIINKNSEYKYGLIIFSSTSNFFIPSTYDYKQLIIQLENINSNFLPGGDTNIYEGINKFYTNTKKGTLGIIFSDFGNNNDLSNQKNKITELAKRIKEKKQTIIPIGVGKTTNSQVYTPNGTKLIINGKNITDSRFDEFGTFIEKKFSEKYIKIEKSKIGNKIQLTKTLPINNQNKINLIELIGSILNLIGI